VIERRPWSAWMSSGSVVMAIIAVVALGATVLLADRALSEASDIVVRGEEDSLVSTVVADLTEEGTTPTAALLDRELAAQVSRKWETRIFVRVRPRCAVAVFAPVRCFFNRTMDQVHAPIVNPGRRRSWCSSSSRR